MPDRELFELEACAALEIPSEQTLREIGAVMQGLKQGEDTGVQARPGIGHFRGERAQIALKIALNIFRRLRQTIVAQSFAGDPRIGPAGVVKPVQRAVETELG